MVRLSIVFILLLFLFSCSVDDVVEVEDRYSVNIDRNKILVLVNEVRLEGYMCGDIYYPPVDTLEWNDNMEEAAYIHCVYMYENDYFDHLWKDGTSVVYRLKMVGYNGTFGENIAWGQDSEEHVIHDWLESPGHCKNIMNPYFRIMGVSKVNIYWTQVFGR